jgi:hypothetical protein
MSFYTTVTLMVILQNLASTARQRDRATGESVSSERAKVVYL